MNKISPRPLENSVIFEVSKVPGECHCKSECLAGSFVPRHSRCSLNAVSWTEMLLFQKSPSNQFLRQKGWELGVPQSFQFVPKIPQHLPQEASKSQTSMNFRPYLWLFITLHSQSHQPRHHHPLQLPKAATPVTRGARGTHAGVLCNPDVGLLGQLVGKTTHFLPATQCNS